MISKKRVANNWTLPLLVLVMASLPPGSAFGQPEWSQTIEAVKAGVVAIRVNQTRGFDGRWNASSEATGFVVDADQGLILTNRHVVTTGPVTATARFINGEEVVLTAVYRDPVHDFGFFRYDPSALRFLEPPALVLYPDGARVGTNIRVLGNDAMDQFSILEGTISRLDRNAPEYDRLGYNDFNTFYIQAAVGATGGSSGSPVIERAGRVVALNAGAKSRAQTSFFLPLASVVRALDLLRAEQPIPRGSLQAMFGYQVFADLRKLGLSDELEREVRSLYPDRVGMLVVQKLIDGSPASEHLRIGDILVQLDGEHIVGFDRLEARLDEAVGEMVTIRVLRAGRLLSAKVPVSDLHELLPTRFMEYDGAVFHDLSYPFAYAVNRSLTGVMLGMPGYGFSTARVPKGAVIVEMNGRPIADLEDLRPVLLGDAPVARLDVRYFVPEDPRHTQLVSIMADRGWFPARWCEREVVGDWRCHDEQVAPAAPPSPTAGAAQLDRGLESALVEVEFRHPFSLDGDGVTHNRGSGLVVDADAGLVITDRATVPHALGDVSLIFEGRLEIGARVAGIHPVHNVTLLAFDPNEITGLQPSRVDFREPQTGELVRFMSRRPGGRVNLQSMAIAGIDPMQFPESALLTFREINLSGIRLTSDPPGGSGFLFADDGALLGLWAGQTVVRGRRRDQVYYGVPAPVVADVIHHYREGRPYGFIGAELTPLSVADATRLGLPETWARQLMDNPAGQVLQVSRIVQGSDAEARLRSGDLILAVDGRAVADPRGLERAISTAPVRLTVLRAREMVDVPLEPMALSGDGISRLLQWSGAALIEPHLAGRLIGVRPDAPYVAFLYFGSPAQRFGLGGLQSVLAVDDQPVSSLDDFERAVRDAKDGAVVRLRVRGWDGAEQLITLRVDLKWWSGYRIEVSKGEAVAPAVVKRVDF